jgi:hypothetical protein
MKFGLYVGSRAGATCAGPPDPQRIGPLVDELSGGRPFVIRIRPLVWWQYRPGAGDRRFSPHGDVHAATLHAVNQLRAHLAEAHFPPDVPIHIAEAGSPSSSGVGSSGANWPGSWPPEGATQR